MILQGFVSYVLLIIACNVLLYRFVSNVMKLLDTFSTVLQESASCVSMKGVCYAKPSISVLYVILIMISLKAMPPNYASHVLWKVVSIA